MLTKLSPLMAQAVFVLLSVVLVVTMMPGVVAAAWDKKPSARLVESFERISTYGVMGEVVEIVASTPDGMTLVYTNPASQEIGFVDLTDPSKPVSAGSLVMPGEPASVAVTPDSAWALVAVHSVGNDALVIVDVATRAIDTTIALAGQPDSVAISPNGRYAAVAIENQRNEEVNGGAMPQGPAGLLTIIDLVEAPSAWTTRDVALTDLADRFPGDPEPEFVSINSSNQAAVTLQENNHIVIVDLATAGVLSHWSAGTTTHAADTMNDNNIDFSNTLTNARREPDGIKWTPGGRLITANEGDYDLDLTPGQFVGGRDFTVFNSDGTVVYEPGAAFELEAVRHGHYPDTRSDSKGTEPEGIEIGVFQERASLFVASERGNFVSVYHLDDELNPVFVQLLPTGISPEGLLAIPQRNLFVTANEVDGTISIFEGKPGAGASEGRL